METNLYHDFGSGPWTRDSWNALAATSETNTIFQTYEWHEAWWRTYGRRSRALILAATEGGRLVGLAPLMVGQGAATAVSFIGDGRSDYHDFIVSRGDKEAFVDSVLSQFSRSRSDWGRLKLNNIPAASSTVPLVLAQARRRQLHPLLRPPTVNHALVMSGAAPGALAVMNKADLRRRTGFLRKSGELSFFHVRDPAAAARYLPVFFEQHIRRWSRTASASLFRAPENQAFYRALVDGLLGRDWLLWSVLQYNGEPIAFHFGFDYAGVVTWYKPSFDVRFANRSPGKVLLQHLIDYSLREGRKELDFTVGDEEFKRRFKNTTRSNHLVTVFGTPFARAKYSLLMRMRLSMGRLRRGLAAAVSSPRPAGGDGSL